MAIATPTATIFLPYHALDDVIQRGTRAAQPDAADVVPGTLYGVTDEGDVVERSNGTAWEPYGATSGGVAPHHTTHEPGGSDALTALSASILTSGTLPVARLGAGTTTVVARSDTGTVHDWAPGLAGNTIVVCEGTADLTITGIAGGVPGQLVTLRNTGTGNRYLVHNSPASAASARLFHVATSSLTPLGQNGSATYVYDGVNSYWVLLHHEQGTWITPPFNAANFQATGGMTWTVEAGDVGTYAYRLSGRTLSIRVNVSTTSLGGTAGLALRVVHLGEFTIAAPAPSVLTPYWWSVTNGSARALGVMLPEAAVLTLYQNPIVNWALNTNLTEINLTASYEVA